MARIVQFKPSEKVDHKVHQVIECCYFHFATPDGKRYLQLDTLGSRARKIPGKVSQTIQLDEDGAREMLRVIKEAFPNL